MTFTRPLILLAAFLLPATVFAQDAEVKAQKAAAVENMKRAGVDKPAAVETTGLLVYSSLTEGKTKPIADTAQKAFDAAKKALKFDDKDKPWAGRLTVYVLADRKEYASFVRLVESRKPEADETWAVQVRGAEPYAAVGAKTETALAGEAAAGVAVALLDQKAGASSATFTLPSWLHTGFGRAIAVRQNPRALDDHRAKVKALFAKNKLGTFAAAQVWSTEKLKDADTYATSLVEYLVFGADEGKFAKFLGGYKPGENQPEPTTANALEAANWTPEALDTAWKTWVVKGK
jgi:hypothetical protein